MTHQYEVLLTRISYLELVSDILGSFVLRLLVLQVGESLLGHQLHVGELVPGVGGESVAELGDRCPGVGVKLSDLSGADLYIMPQFLQNRFRE